MILPKQTKEGMMSRDHTLWKYGKMFFKELSI